MSQLRVAVVGCGKIAEQHLWAISRIPRAEVVAVCDNEQLMADQLAERWRVPHRFGNVGSLLRDVRPDVIHITTPPQSHFALAAECLEAGCHVYVEKPFTVNSDEAMVLLRMATAQGLKITAGHNAQFNWENSQARRMVRDGYLGGPPIYIESYYTYSISDARYAKAVLGDKNHWVRRLPGKLLHNIISHGIARIAEYMTTDEPRVFATGYSSPLLQSIGETEIVDELRVHIADGGNLSAAFVFSTQISPPVNGCRLYGPTNSLVIDNVHHTVVRRDRRGYKSYANYFIPPVQVALQHLRSSASNVARFVRSDFHDDSGLKSLVNAFYLSVLGEGPLPLSYEEILRTALTMDAIFDQLEQQALGKLEPWPVASSPD